MFRTLLGVRPFTRAGVPSSAQLRAVRLNSSFDQLTKAVRGLENTERNTSTVLDVDSLLKGAVEPQSPSHFGRATDNLLFENTLKHPRDVARGMRVLGPLAGRTVEVPFNNIGAALGGLNNTIRLNKIRYLQKVQKRFIPPAKYAKQKKREWWRRQFSHGFKELMAQVRDAKRRGY